MLNTLSETKCRFELEAILNMKDECWPRAGSIAEVHPVTWWGFFLNSSSVSTASQWTIPTSDVVKCIWAQLLLKLIKEAVSLWPPLSNTQREPHKVNTPKAVCPVMGIWPAPHNLSLMPAQVVFEEQSKFHFDSKACSDALWLTPQILGSSFATEILSSSIWVGHYSTNAAIVSTQTGNATAAVASYDEGRYTAHTAQASS